MTRERAVDRRVLMVRYECDVCSMSATCVSNPAAELAWLDHMATHADPSLFKGWYWEVVPLPMGI